MSILSNHEHFNRFQVLQGMKQTQNNAVPAYILECKLKKIVRLHATVDILKQLSSLNIRNLGRKFLVIKQDDLLHRIQKVSAPRLKKLIALFEEEGILECLIHLMNLKK